MQLGVVVWGLLRVHVRRFARAGQVLNSRIRRGLISKPPHSVAAGAAAASGVLGEVPRLTGNSVETTVLGAADSFVWLNNARSYRRRTAL